MSGTSGDGVDASIIKTNGIDHYETILDRWYDSVLHKDIHTLKENQKWIIWKIW